jgi:hypothetical protein
MWSAKAVTAVKPMAEAARIIEMRKRRTGLLLALKLARRGERTPVKLESEHLSSKT